MTWKTVFHVANALAALACFTLFIVAWREGLVPPCDLMGLLLLDGCAP